MTPAEKEEFRRMLANALQPIQDQIDALKIENANAAPIEMQLAELKARAAAVGTASGQHRLGAQIVQLKNEAQETRAEDLSAIASAMRKLIEICEETVDRSVRTEQTVALIHKQNQTALVKVTEGNSVTIKPASLVAAESSVRTEDKQAAMSKDTERTEKTTREAATWQKRWQTPILVVVPIIVEVYRQLFPHH